MLEEDYRDHLDSEATRTISVMRPNCKRMATPIDILLAFCRLCRSDVTKNDLKIGVLLRER